METRTPDPSRRAALAKSRPFAELPERVHAWLFEVMQEVRYADGERLIAQGDPGDFLLVLVDGEVVVTRDEGAESVPVATLAAPEVVGEMALVTNKPRNADVTAKGGAVALKLARADFERLGREHPAVAILLTNVVARRLSESAGDGVGGIVIDRYRVDREVGRGAMAVVYEAHDQATAERVALKMMEHRLMFEEDGPERFQREARILLRLAHENIAGVRRHFPAFETQFIAIEFCDGPALADWTRVHGALPEPLVRAMLGQLARALRYLHGEGVIHRDLKPANVMSTSQGIVKLADFGLAVLQDGTTERDEMLSGTPLYMAPEQITGEPQGPAADLYALGLIAWRLLAGEMPFTSQGLAPLLYEKMHFEVPEELPLPASPEMADVVRGALERDPKTRHVDLDTVAEWAEPIDPAVLRLS